MDELYWLGKDSKPAYDDYSRISTCLALSQSVYALNGDACVATLNELKDSMQHGISQVLFSVNCKRQYIIALKERTKEIYIAFRGTESWKALLISFRVYAYPNDFQGTLHSGYYQQAKLIPLAPFFYLLNKYKHYKLIFTGHSLGGAVATIVTLNMLADLRSIDFKEQIYCVAFGSPFVGNQACSSYVDKLYQSNFQFYINHQDVIPYLLTFIYNQTSDLLSEPISKKCSEWLKTLALSLVAGGLPVGVFSRWARRFGLKRSSTQEQCESEFLGLSKYIIETCRDALKQMLPDYHPFGLYFCTHCTSVRAGTETTFTVTQLSLKDVFKEDIRLDDDIICSIQDHFIKNYINEIYINVIAKKQIVPRMDCPPVSLIKCSSDFSSSSPLCLFLPPEITSWKWKDLSEKYENENPSYMWSVVASKYDDKEEITLRIYGSAVSLITGLKCENSVYAEKALAPIESHDESVRLFILYLPARENRCSNNYPFYIISHFDTVNLTGLFDPKKFTPSNGIRGREQQIADLTVLELYKLAYVYCICTDDQMTDATGIDIRRRKNIERYLLASEKILEKDCHMLEKDYLSRLTEKQLRELMKQISYTDNDSENLEESHPSSPYQSEDEYDGTAGCFGRLLDPKDEENDSSLPKNVDFLNISNAMSNWRDNMSKRQKYQSQTSKMSDSSNNVLSTTGSVVQVIPRLFTMYIALTNDFALKFDVHDISWKQIGIATIGGCILGFLGGVFFLSTLLGGLSATVGSGVVVGGVKGVYECLKSVHIEYLKILVLVAKSLGVIMDQVRMHQYCLEEKISSIYHDRLREFPTKEHVLDEWKNIFPGGILNKLQNREKQYYCLSIIKCIDANFQMRKLLSKDFALGVIGPGKSGKSTVLQNMFGFSTNPDKEIRTEDLQSYRVNGDFRVVDFPHMTSVFDYVKNCFTCNHTLVNAIIVVLNAEQGGNDSDGEGYVVNEVKKLAKKGVNVLFCFNQCDKLALTKGRQHVRRRVDKFALYETDKIPLSNAANGNDQCEYWTEEHVENKRQQWAKNYQVDSDKCWMIFCDLEETDEIKCQENYKRLVSIKLRTYLDIKEIWLKEVLKENSLSEKSISEIMSFRYD